MATYTVAAGQVLADATIPGDIYGTYYDTLDVLGRANYTTISAGGEEDVLSGGISYIDTIDGGVQVVKAGGTADYTTIMSGSQRVEVAGFSNLTTINSGAVEEVYGIAYATTIDAGGLEEVAAGGAIGGQTIINGGTLELSGGILPGSYVGFTGAGGYIDLPDFSFGKGTKLMVKSNRWAGTTALTVTNGIQSETINLVGVYNKSNFRLSQEKGGTGTLITEKPSGAPQVANDVNLLVQSAASFGTSDSGVAPLKFAGTITQESPDLTFPHHP